MSAEPTGASPALERSEPIVPRARAWSRLRVRELPTAAWLTLIVAMSTTLRFGIAASVPAPAIFPDEIVYSELARGVASSGDFLVRDIPYPGWTYGPVYVLLIAPVYRIAALPDAYLAAKAIGTLLMSLAAIPAYFLARRLLGRRDALLAAALTLLLPAMAFSSRVMTEGLFLPVFLVGVLAIVACLERPTRRRQLALTAAIALAILTRAQAVVFVPAFIMAAILLAWLEARSAGGKRSTIIAQRLASYKIVWFSLAISGVVALVAAGARGGSPVSLGNRHERVGEGLQPLEAPKWILYHVAGLDLAVGILPFASFLLLAAAIFFRSEHRAAWPFVVAAVSVTTWLLLMIGLYATQPGPTRFRERYLFYVEPLFLISLLAWARAERPRVRGTATVLVLAAVMIPFTLYFASLIGFVYEAPALGLWVSLKNGGEAVVLVALTVFAAAAGYLMLRTPSRPTATAVVILYLVVASLFATASFRLTSKESLTAGVGDGDRTWIDRAVGSRANVAAIWSGREEQWDRYRVIWLSEFFNRSVGPVYYLRDVPFVLSETRVRVSGRTLVLPDERPLRAEYVLSDGPVIVGRRVASQPQVDLTLYRVDGPVQLARGRK